MIILRDGDPGEPEQSLGGFDSSYYQHAVEIEVYVEEGDAAVRDTVFDQLSAADRRMYSMPILSLVVLPSA